jgi:hypothetical protein
MELIEINGRRWQKYKGDEGQDVYIAEFTIPEDELLGKYVGEESYDILIDNDADFYLPPSCDMTKAATCDRQCMGCMSETEVAFKFRKNVFTQEEQDGAFAGLYSAASESNNRGMAAGPRSDKQQSRDWVTPYQTDVLKFFIDGQPKAIDGSDQLETIRLKHVEGKHETRGEVWLRSRVEKEFGSYEAFFPQFMENAKAMDVPTAAEYAKMIRDKFISQTSYASVLWSGITGFYGRYPRIPYGRATAHVEHNRADFEKCYPFARKLEKEFARLLPERHGKQAAFAERLDNKFLVGEDTTFTTITVNTTTKDRNARMACHRDAGSLNEGFSNLTVIAPPGKDWKNGYLVAPEVRAAVNVRPGDLLLIDNMRVIHGNTPIEAPESGEDDMLRMSLVFYFREDMDGLGSYEYESLRRQFVDTRRKNPEHPLWREFWNGVSPNMWFESEWYEYLEAHGGREMVEEYHPEAYEVKSSLEGFF